MLSRGFWVALGSIVRCLSLPPAQTSVCHCPPSVLSARVDFQGIAAESEQQLWMNESGLFGLFFLGGLFQKCRVSPKQFRSCSQRSN